jgi:hypothetical protein
MHRMRRPVVGLVCGTLLLVGCSSSAKNGTPATTTSTRPPTTVASTSAPTTRPVSSTTVATTTTTVACPDTGSVATVATSTTQVAALLTNVTVTNSGCNDRVAFAYEAGGVAPPSCRVGYQSGPFSQDASGAPVAVAGTAFVVVRCFPAYGFDFETGKRTYTGPKRIEATGTRHVREIVETGDNEGVLTWVVGLDAPRAFSIAATGAPAKQLTITFS